MQKVEMFSLPIALTLSRLVLGPLFLMFYLYHESMGIPFVALPYILLSLSLISELSDLFDGFFARKLNQVTELGKLLDPMADSIFRISVFFVLTKGVVQLPVLVVLLFFYRDSVIGTLRTLCALRGGIALAARWSGKVKAFLQGCIIIGMIVMMIPYSLGYLSLETLQTVSFWATLSVALYSIGSGIEYLYVNRQHIKKAIS